MNYYARGQVQWSIYPAAASKKTNRSIYERKGEAEVMAIIFINHQPIIILIIARSTQSSKTENAVSPCATYESRVSSMRSARQYIDLRGVNRVNCSPTNQWSPPRKYTRRGCTENSVTHGESLRIGIRRLGRRHGHRSPHFYDGAWWSPEWEKNPSIKSKTRRVQLVAEIASYTTLYTWV